MSATSGTVPIVLSRWADLTVLLRTPGDEINWTRGDPAWFTSERGTRHRVVIDSGWSSHADAPGVLCLECIFVDECGARFCVEARSLRIGDGWNPAHRQFDYSGEVK